MKQLRCVYMRGGTSKGLVFRREELPADRAEWDAVFLRAMGAPDPKQTDGLGGTLTSNNKIVVVWKADDPRADVGYLIGQVMPGRSQVDYRSNCGNMTAAVGPFAVAEGLVQPSEPFTTVRLHNENTDRYVEVRVPVENGAPSETGDCAIAGVDGTGPELQVRFLEPSGAKTGRLLPTGNRIDTLELPDGGQVRATLLDVANPLVLVRAKELGMTGTESPDQIDRDEALMERLEAIRGTAAVRMGLSRDLADATANSPAIPKIGIVSAAQDYPDLSGRPVAAADMDFCARILSGFRCHKSTPVTSACAVAVAARLPGCILDGIAPQAERNAPVRFGHPGGVIALYPDVETAMMLSIVHSVAVVRTARRILDGTLYL